MVLDGGSGNGTALATVAPARRMDRLGLFSILWSLQGLVQLATFFRQERSPLWWLLAFASVAVLARPWSTRALVGMVAVNIAYSWTQLPYTVNHLLFEDIVNLIVLGALAAAWWRHRGTTTLRDATIDGFAPAVRAAVVVLYAWAAFAKLNVDYFDPAVSCASRLLDDAVRLDVTSGRLSSFAVFAALAGVVAESALAVMLAIPRLRAVAIPLGLAFHLTLAVVPYVRGFTFMMFALYLLFTSRRFQESLLDLGVRAVAIGRASLRRAHSGPAVAAAVGSVAIVVSIARWGLRDAVYGAFDGGRFVGLVAGLVAYIGVARRVGFRHAGSREPFLGGVPGLWLLVGLVVVRGAMPYAGFGTEAAFTMFSNLRTEDGETNHFVVPNDTQFVDYQERLVRILASDSSELQAVADKGHVLTRFEFERIVRNSGDLDVVCECYGSTRHITKVDGVVAGLDEPAAYSRRVGSIMAFRPVSDQTLGSCVH